MNTIDLDIRGYRPCVGLCLMRGDGRVFVGERLDRPGAWQFPQGGIDEGEDVVNAAFRELYEETGIGRDHAQLLRVHPSPLRYDIPEDYLKRIEWGHLFKGQEQHWVALRFLGGEHNIHLTLHSHPEFARHQWVDLRDVPSLAVPFKRKTYEQVAGFFQDLCP